MGGEPPPELILQAAVQVAESSSAQLLVFVTRPVRAALSGPFHPRVEFVVVEESIAMGESPLLAVRRKRRSSMAVGMRLLQEGALDAFLSTGNTGALVATATLVLGTLPGIERPALLVTMPTARGRVLVLDVGANVHPKPLHLVQYARLGIEVWRALYEGTAPTLGLLNVGTEEQKGTKELKETYLLLQEGLASHFIGNVEGREVFQGRVDVLVTDGFTGNVFLKTSEGVSSFLIHYVEKRFSAPEITTHLHKQFNYAEYPGALLCGVKGLVVKCHGYSDLSALVRGIRGALDLVSLQLMKKLYTNSLG